MIYYGSIFELPERSDMFSAHDFNRLFSSLEGQAELSISRNPLGAPGSPLKHLMCWVFADGSNDPEYCAALGPLTQSQVAFDDRYVRNRARLKLPFLLGRFLSFHQMKFIELSDLRQQILVESADWGLSDLERGILDRAIDRGYVIWGLYAQMRVCVICERQNILVESPVEALSDDLDSDSANNSEQEILRPGTAEREAALCGRIFDYFMFRYSCFRDVPFKFFLDKLSADQKIMFYADPPTFCPLKETREEIFLWPWQSCLIRDPSKRVKKTAIISKSIQTISLVIDIRNSTEAMDLSPDPFLFSNFIDAVVEQARNVILKFGGFFDKDTGDGVVGHFACETYEWLGDHFLFHILALKAANTILNDIEDICVNFARELEHGVGALGAGVGIHSGSAVWLANERQIRAIGPSVVWADRLCGDAKNGEILVSQGFLRRAEQELGEPLSDCVTERGVNLKGKDPALDLKGFSFNRHSRIIRS